jgi:hypothetical protein
VRLTITLDYEAGGRDETAAAGVVAATVTSRLWLRPADAAWVPAGSRVLRCVNGNVWVTRGGRDTVLGPGDLLLASGRAAEAALVSPLGGRAAVLEWEGADDVWVTQPTTTARFWKRWRARSANRPKTTAGNSWT